MIPNITAMYYWSEWFLKWQSRLSGFSFSSATFQTVMKKQCNIIAEGTPIYQFLACTWNYIPTWFFVVCHHRQQIEHTSRLTDCYFRGDIFLVVSTRTSILTYLLASKVSFFFFFSHSILRIPISNCCVVKLFKPCCVWKFCIPWKEKR